MRYILKPLEKMLNKELREKKIDGSIIVYSLRGGLNLFYVKDGVKYFFFFPLEAKEAYEDWITYIIDPKEVIDYISKRIGRINTSYIG